MSELRLNYSQDDAPNQTGSLDVSVQVEGFAGSRRVYVSELQLTGFAERLAAYPIPNAGIVLQAPELAIAVAPLNSRGHLKVTIAFPRLDWGELRQQAKLQLATDYAAIDTFRRALISAAKNGSGEALLAGSR
jgi:hypothetical protein